MTLLVITAVDAERDAICNQLRPETPARVIVGGVGPAASAAAASAALAGDAVELVLCAGIGGGFAPLGIGDIAVAGSVAFADLGAQDGARFLPLEELGFGTARYDVAPRLAVELTDVTGGHLGTVLTVATATGTDETAAAHRARYPDAVAEAMEGAGVAAAAVLHRVPFAEVRAISNPVGRRDGSAWDIPRALTALGAAVAAVVDGAHWTL
jgi:futalosine hydrolase